MEINKKLLSVLGKNCSELLGRKYAFNGVQYFFSGYDLVNSAIVYNQVIASQPSGIAIFHPTSTLFLVNAVNAALFAESLQVITSGSGGACRFSPGEKVIYKGSLGVFEEECIVHGRESLKVSFGGKQNDVVYVSKSNSAEIVPYSGRFEKLRGFKNKVRKDVTTVLSSMFSMNRAALSLKDRSVVAVVTERKEELVNALRALTIDGHPFLDLFTTEVFSGAERSSFLGRTRLKEKTALAIFPSLNILDEYLSGREGFSTLIVDGHSKLKNRYGILNAIKDLGKSRNVFLFLNSGDLVEKEFLVENNFRIWSWLKSDIDFLADRDIEGNLKHPFLHCRNHAKYLSNLRDQQVRMIDIAISREVLDSYSEQMSFLKKLRKMTKEIEHSDLNEFFMLAYGLLLHYAHFPVPKEYLKNCDGMKFFDIDNAVQKLIDLGHSLSAKVLDESTGKLINQFCHGSRSLAAMFVHSKGKRLLEALHTENSTSTAIVVRKGWHVPILQGWLAENEVKGVKVVDLSTVKSSSFSPVDRMILMGCFGPETALIINKGLSSQIDVLFYPFEQHYIKYYFTSSQKHIESADARAQLLGVKQELLASRGLTTEGQQEVPDLKNDIFLLLEDITTKVAQTAYPHVEGEDVVEAKRIVFDDGSCAFLTQYYSARRLDRISGKLESVLLEEISEGDELLFVDDERRDILDELIHFSEGAPVWTENIKVARLWKMALRKIESEHSDPVTVLQSALAGAGCNRHRATIENWFKNEKLIAPEQEELVFEVIAGLTKDSVLKERVNDVIDACRKIRAFHIKLGKYLVGCILTAMDHDSAKELDDIIKKRIVDLAKHAYILQVKCIAADWGNVIRGKTNRVLELGE